MNANGADEVLHAASVIWTAGVRANPFAKILADAAGIPQEKGGRVRVEPDLSLPGRPEVLVIGDMAHCSPDGKHTLPGVAPVAMQQGRYAAKLIRARLAGETIPPFHYVDKGSLATIGRAAAVADVFGFRFNGGMAWLTWLFVHLMYLVEFQNRLLVLFQWAWNYFTRNRAARLITYQNK